MQSENQQYQTKTGIAQKKIWLELSHICVAGFRRLQLITSPNFL